MARFEKVSRKRVLTVNFEHVTQSYNPMDDRSDGQQGFFHLFYVITSEENLILILFRLQILNFKVLSTRM